MRIILRPGCGLPFSTYDSVPYLTLHPDVEHSGAVASRPRKFQLTFLPKADGCLVELGLPITLAAYSLHEAKDVAASTYASSGRTVMNASE